MEAARHHHHHRGDGMESWTLLPAALSWISTAALLPIGSESVLPAPAPAPAPASAPAPAPALASVKGLSLAASTIAAIAYAYIASPRGRTKKCATSATANDKLALLLHRQLGWLLFHKRKRRCWHSNEKRATVFNTMQKGATLDACAAELDVFEQTACKRLDWFLRLSACVVTLCSVTVLAAICTNYFAGSAVLGLVNFVGASDAAAFVWMLLTFYWGAVLVVFLALWFSMSSSFDPLFAGQRASRGRTTMRRGCSRSTSSHILLLISYVLFIAVMVAMLPTTSAVATTPPLSSTSVATTTANMANPLLPPTGRTRTSTSRTHRFEAFCSRASTASIRAHTTPASASRIVW